MLIGPTGGGKTTARLILQHALHLLPSLSEVHRRTSVFMQVLHISLDTSDRFLKTSVSECF